MKTLAEVQQFIKKKYEFHFKKKNEHSVVSITEFHIHMRDVYKEILDYIDSDTKENKHD